MIQLEAWENTGLGYLKRKIVEKKKTEDWKAMPIILNLENLSILFFNESFPSERLGWRRAKCSEHGKKILSLGFPEYIITLSTHFSNERLSV